MNEFWLLKFDFDKSEERFEIDFNKFIALLQIVEPVTVVTSNPFPKQSHSVRIRRFLFVFDHYASRDTWRPSGQD